MNEHKCSSTASVISFLLSLLVFLVSTVCRRLRFDSFETVSLEDSRRKREHLQKFRKVGAHMLRYLK
jgi:hypothetical protein